MIRSVDEIVDNFREVMDQKYDLIDTEVRTSVRDHLGEGEDIDRFAGWLSGEIKGDLIGIITTACERISKLLERQYHNREMPVNDAGITTSVAAKYIVARADSYLMNLSLQLTPDCIDSQKKFYDETITAFCIDEYRDGFIQGVLDVLNHFSR